MAILEIRKYPDAILKKKTGQVTEFDYELQKLVDDMIETMYAAPGIGLAANQVGVSKQVAVIDVGARDDRCDLMVLVNPEIIAEDGEIDSEEGCLSVPDYTTVIKRAEKVRVRAFDRHGKPVEVEGDGLLARALQHEIDHLNGLLLIDRIGRVKREFFRKRFAREHSLDRE